MKKIVPLMIKQNYAYNEIYTALCSHINNFLSNSPSTNISILNTI